MNKSFISYAATLLTNTNLGLSSTEVCKYSNQYAVEYNISIPHFKLPFSKQVSNKAQALCENLMYFNPEAQYRIILELCTLEKFNGNQEVKNLQLKLMRDYSQYAPKAISEQLLNNVKQVLHWLDAYPDAKVLYEDALRKKNNQIELRNLLDDLRLSFELLVKQVLKKGKSLENLKSDLANYLNVKANSEINHLYIAIVFDFFTKYQNENIKHKNTFKEIEVDFIFNQTTILMLFLIQLDRENPQLPKEIQTLEII